MTYAQFLRSTAVGLAAAGILAQSALAGGEPKNQWPFTRTLDNRSTQGVARSTVPAPMSQGEMKNEAPFVRPATIVAAGSGGGFSWTDAAIGGVAGIGVALAGAGALAVARKPPRPA